VISLKEVGDIIEGIKTLARGFFVFTWLKYEKSIGKLVCTLNKSFANTDSTSNNTLAKSHVFMGYGFQSHTPFWLK
jgi:hypothetical protein